MAIGLQLWSRPAAVGVDEFGPCFRLILGFFGLGGGPFIGVLFSWRMGFRLG